MLILKSFLDHWIIFKFYLWCIYVVIFDNSITILLYIIDIVGVFFMFCNFAGIF